MKTIPLEDDFNDVIGKAQRGLGLTEKQLAHQAGVLVGQVSDAKAGQFDEAVVRNLARALHLGADALVDLAQKAWYPQDSGEVPGLACFNTPYGAGMTVNAYLVWDPNSGNGLCFDTGADASSLLQFAAEREIRVQMVLLTHTHPDHVADLGKITGRTAAKAFVCKLESFPEAEVFEAGYNFRVGPLIISTRQTSGHSRGGITYVVDGLPRRLAVVGDALFAGSMGGGMVSYAEALRNNCEHILTLPDDTILCPGHGPLTTVGEEKVHNPFFPHFSRHS
ncbi:MAG TPA: MBL fold metallo-hydrolase [Bacillota bacterium]|nr:MBL fold metallo-hydrolase [Bacillota bacterium]